VGAAEAANATDGAALVDGFVVVRGTEFEVHGTSNELISSQPGSREICAGRPDSRGGAAVIRESAWIYYPLTSRR
jgi:hypothetical protein